MEEKHEHSHDHIHEEPKQVSMSEYKKLMGQYFTVHRDIVAACGHKFKTPPTNNCENCWWAFFQIHGELTSQLDETFRNPEMGKAFLVNKHGKKFVDMFCRFMATVIKMKQEVEESKGANGSEARSEAGEITESTNTEQDVQQTV